MSRAKEFLTKNVSYNRRRTLKRVARRIRNIFKKSQESLSIDAFRSLLIGELGIDVGDAVIVSSSFANLNAQFGPDDLIDTLMDVVGLDGNIVMPFYPPGLSDEWLRSGQVFDMQHTRSSMGVLTQKFSERPGVVKSIHPTKAVVAWGRDAEVIVSQHHLATTPFDESSPYGWLLKNSSKSLGLGLKNIPMLHACEDFLPTLHPNLYLEERFFCAVKNGAEEFMVPTLVHCARVSHALLAPGDYVQHLNLSSYRRINAGYSFCYSVDNQDLLEQCKINFAAGRFRYKK